MTSSKRAALIIAGLVSFTPALFAGEAPHPKTPVSAKPAPHPLAKPPASKTAKPPASKTAKPPASKTAKPPTSKTAKPVPSESSEGGGIETAVLVFDASGSMLGKLGGRTKLQVAKDAVGKLLDGWDTKIPLGLTAYGHRGHGCSDVEALLPVEPVDKTKFLKVLDELPARRGTPLTAAVIAAAEQLDYEHNQATVIVISDGQESCQANPCEAAKALKQKGVDLKVHVVALGVSDAAGSKNLACLAENTGGKFATAKDAASLNEVLAGMVADVNTRKDEWRKRWGKHWGTNGRWHDGCWTRDAKPHRPPKPDQPKPDQPKPDQPKPDQPKPPTPSPAPSPSPPEAPPKPDPLPLPRPNPTPEPPPKPAPLPIPKPEPPSAPPRPLPPTAPGKTKAPTAPVNLPNDGKPAPESSKNPTTPPKPGDSKTPSGDPKPPVGDSKTPPGKTPLPVPEFPPRR